MQFTNVCVLIVAYTIQFMRRFIHYIYKYTPTYWVTFPSYPTRETEVQIGMALLNDLGNSTTSYQSAKSLGHH